jgi:hypothetical protein
VTAAELDAIEARAKASGLIDRSYDEGGPGVNEAARDALVLVAAVRELRAVVEQQEWYDGMCYVCFRVRYQGHESDCVVAKALGKP